MQFFYIHLMNNALCQEWLLRASEVSAGAGSHKDYHMSYLAEWLSQAIEKSQYEHKLPVLEKFARAIEVAGGDGADYAALSVLRLMLILEPHRATSFAIELDRSRCFKYLRSN